jgi:hypothetical protein
MLLLFLGDSYLNLYVGWEGVGLASYLLIGFWNQKPAYATAAKKAFVANRVGDVGLSLAIMIAFATFGDVTFKGIEEHADHGWSYVSTVSLVAYPNDDYEGGELYFPKLNINIKPEKGDLYIFPSAYLFSHIAMPVRSGTKYSFVTMLDYNDDTHTEEYEDYIDRKYGKK